MHLEIFKCKPYKNDMQNMLNGLMAVIANCLLLSLMSFLEALNNEMQNSLALKLDIVNLNYYYY